MGTENSQFEIRGSLRETFLTITCCHGIEHLFLVQAEMGPSKKLCSTLKNISRKKMRGDFLESTKQFSYEMMMIYFYKKK
jgi:hypothetical protein